MELLRFVDDSTLQVDDWVSVTVGTYAGEIAQIQERDRHCLFSRVRLKGSDLSVQVTRWALERVEAPQDAEEQAWDTTLSQPHVQAGLARLADEAKRQYAAGKTVEGGFAVEEQEGEQS